MKEKIIKKIDYFNIEGTPGGNQEWFSDFWMHLGGCGALAACDLCICLALNHGMTSCLPFPSGDLSRKNYEVFGMIMEPYIKPRMGGVTELSFFTEGCGAYLERHGFDVTFSTISGEEDYDKAVSFVKDHMENNLPIAYLNLSHKDKEFKDLWWHWFSVTGYRETKEGMKLIFHTYGEENEVDFRRLWNTEMTPKGGMVAVSEIRRI